MELHVITSNIYNRYNLRSLTVFFLIVCKNEVFSSLEGQLIPVDNRPVDLEPVVILTDLSGGHNVVDQTLVLKCRTTFSQENVDIEWYSPQGVHFTTNLSEDINSNFRTISRLTISKAKLFHSGFYQCRVTSKKWNQSYWSETFITVYEVDQHIIKFDKKRSVFVELNREIQVYIKAHPNISITWLDTNNKTITERNSSKYIIYTGSNLKDPFFNYCTRLHFVNFSIDDYGSYTVVAENKFGIASYSIVASELVSSSVWITSNINESTMSVEFKCSAKAAQITEIKWYFFPCDRSKCTDYIYEQQESKAILPEDVQPYLKNESRNEGRGQITTSCFTLNMSSNGFLGYWEQNTQMLSISEIIFYVRGDFTVSVNEYNDETKNLYVEYYETVKILCAISLDKYVGKIKWYLNGKGLNENIIEYQLKSFYSLKKLWSVVIFSNLFEYQAGNYSCEVLTRSGNVESKGVTVIQKRILHLFPRIFMRDLNNGHTVRGNDVKLRCRAVFCPPINIEWFYKWNEHIMKKLDSKRVGVNKTMAVNSRICITTSDITIRTNESSTYTYIVETPMIYNSMETYDNVLSIRVHDKDTGFITFNKSRCGFYRKNMQIKVFMTAHPNPTIRWFTNTGEEILANSSIRYHITSKPLLVTDENSNNYGTFLTFRNRIEFKDNGNYTVVAKNEYDEQIFSVNIIDVRDQLTINLNLYELNEENETRVFKCTAEGYPIPAIQWSFAKCSLSCFDHRYKHRKEFVEMKELHSVKNGLQNISYISVNLQEMGILRCTSSNRFHSTHKDEPVFYIKNGFDILVENFIMKNLTKTVEVVGGRMPTILCSVSLENYTGEMGWWELIKKSELNYAVFSIGKPTKSKDLTSLNFLKIPVYDVAIDSCYVCNALTKEGFLKSQKIIVEYRERAYLHINESNMEDHLFQKYVELGSNLTFYCYVTGFPTPIITWYKNNKAINSSHNIQILNNSQVLVLEHITHKDEGTYECEADNEFIVLGKTSDLVIMKNFNWLYILIPYTVLGLVVVITIFTFVITFRKTNKRIKELKLAGLVNFERGDLENLNPELRINDQAELLPYNLKWEIPRKKLKLGRELGSGAFGVVIEAEIFDYFPYETTRTVAVKTVRKNLGFDCVKALTSELKIMAHLGKHLNIVNLLGACTKNIYKKELYVIVEYCHYGNLLDWIQRHSENFIDQRDHETSEFNWKIGSKEHKFIENQSTSYVNVQKSTPESFEMSEYKENLTVISSKDFLIWAFQIAQGMEYLGSRRIVHGDLAARNVLLTENNIVKVSDFGLAKRIYQDKNYIKRGEGRLPLRWLAVEAIGKGIFSIQSDIWSFGIVLWEFFSLGQTPYPGIPFDFQTFCNTLLGGYRMEQPKYATTAIYEIMLDCWNSDPVRRPLFATLAEKLGSFIQEPVKLNYIEVDNDYMSSDCQQEDPVKEDYLSMLSVPTFENIVSNPLYSNVLENN